MPHWFRTGPLQKNSNKKLTWPVMSANLMCCDLWPGTWGKRKSKLLAVLLDFSTQKLLQENRSQSQGIYYWAGNTIKGKNKYQQEKRKDWLSVLTHLPSEILMVGSCFNNDSLNWWQCSLELSLDPVLCFIKHLMKKRKVIATRKDVPECYSAELILSWSSHASVTFQRLELSLSRNLLLIKSWSLTLECTFEHFRENIVFIPK